MFTLRRFKPLYWIYNLLHYRKLVHNKAAFKESGLHKPLYASLSAKDFPDKESRAWLDTGDSSQIAASNPSFNNFTPTVKNKILRWSEDGYMILQHFFEEDTVDEMNDEISSLMRRGKLKFENGNKLMFANHKSELIKKITKNERLLAILNFLLGKEVIPFSTINFITGSQQRAHSDSIHMTTYPLGFLVAVWIALEDITADNGPLFYYPGSHKLPYLLNNDFNEGETALLTGRKDYSDYEDLIEEKVKANGYKKEVFLAKKGDLFIWHANFVHGGSPVLNKAMTRKSMVIHYFAKDVIKYHEITERPSLIDIS